MGHLLGGERHPLREDHLARLRVGHPVDLGWLGQALLLTIAALTSGGQLAQTLADALLYEAVDGVTLHASVGRLREFAAHELEEGWPERSRVAHEHQQMGL